MASDSFLTQIILKNHPYLADVEITFPSDEERTLIITGKNGSGKTTLLEQVAKKLLGYSENKNSLDGK